MKEGSTTREQQILKDLNWNRDMILQDPMKNKIFMCLLRNDSRENVLLLLSQVVENNLKLQQSLRDALDNSKIKYFVEKLPEDLIHNITSSEE